MLKAVYDYVTRTEEEEDKRLQGPSLDGKSELDPAPLNGDMYGVSITSLIRDVWKLATRTDSAVLRTTRVIVTFGVMWLTLGMQVFMMYEFRRLVSRSSVHSVRQLYSDYEQWMYEGKTTITENGFHRGMSGFFNPERFDDLPANLSKKKVCSLPLSQPDFFSCILFIWTSTILVDLREVHSYGRRMLFHTDTISALGDMLVEQDDRTVVLRGLTRELKGLLLMCVFLPRVVIDLLLLRIGSAWLLATADYREVLSGTIALEFILGLKTLIYMAYVPKRSKYETSHMLIPQRNSDTKCREYLGTFLSMAVVILWVDTYIFVFQSTLPQYKWDLQQVCSPVIIEWTSGHTFYV
mmetsp:Transcript_92518/g.232647  ORF Transcript_92518/g.232647 Transcript_92518/m.232647 type:complete len:352 (-) Transcript_92518:165-1220(-)